MALITAQKLKLKTGQSVIIRSARPEDAKAILQHARIILKEDLHNVTTLIEFHQTIKKERQWIKEHLEKKGWFVLVAEI